MASEEEREEATDDLLGVRCPHCGPGDRGCANCSDGWIRYPRFMLNRSDAEAADRRQYQRQRLFHRLLFACGVLLVMGILWFIRFQREPN